jgi:phosphomannomutase/phosphoglucomutase
VKRGRMGMINPHVFREYDIRGVAGKDLTDDFVYALGRALGTYFHHQEAERIAVGRDCRLSSPGFRDALVRGLVEAGRQVVDLGVVPTPLVYFATFTLDVHGAVQITGSHNPPEENGFKVCLGNSTLFGPEIQQIRVLMEAGHFVSGQGGVDEQGIIPSYQAHVLGTLSAGSIERCVVVDSGNGTGGLVAPSLYREMGIDVVELNSEPDGRFPQHHPDPTVPENLRDLARAVEEKRADLGIAFDGDADRIGVVDAEGRILWGDQLLILFSREILKERPGAMVIGEVKCSQLLFEDVARHRGQPLMWKVGHSLIKAKMREEGAALAGEMSGHLFFADRYFGYDDAIYAGARLLELLTRRQGTLSSLLADLPPMVNTPEIRVPCPDDRKFQVVKRLVEDFSRDHEVIDVDGARVLFPDGWGLVRASNTQPVLVMRFEARSPEALERIRMQVEARLREIM